MIRRIRVTDLVLLTLVAMFLASCATPPQQQLATLINPSGIKQLAVIESTYGVALAGALAYRNRPRCTKSRLESLTNLCARRSIVVKLIEADRVAQITIDNARLFIASNPTLDATSLLYAATRAVSVFSNIRLGV